MRVTDWVVRMLVVATFFGLILAPQEWGASLALACFAIVGTWSMLYPQGILGWAKISHPSIDVDDRSIWWIPRLIGGCFVAGAAVITFFGAFR